MCERILASAMLCLPTPMGKEHVYVLMDSLQGVGDHLMSYGQQFTIFQIFMYMQRLSIPIKRFAFYMISSSGTNKS